MKKSGQNVKSSKAVSVILIHIDSLPHSCLLYSYHSGTVLQISATPEDVVQKEESRKRVATGDSFKVASLNAKGKFDTAEKMVSKKPRREVEKSVLNDGENHTSIDPFIDAENKEIARLEKLMGIKGGKN